VSERTGIAWTDHTWSPWWGCTKVSEGCRNCYADALDHRLGGDHWGPGRPRRTMTDHHWAQPLKWNASAAAAGVRRKVFPSMCDPFDEEAPVSEYVRFWRLIEATPSLDWLLLMKRVASVPPYRDLAKTHPNVWLGASVEDQAAANERIPALLGLSAAVRFLSVEPLLGPVDLRRWLHVIPVFQSSMSAIDRSLSAPTAHCERSYRVHTGEPIHSEIDWVIVGGESGPGARTCRLRWISDVVEQCRAGGVPCFVKQVGSRPIRDEQADWGTYDRKGGNPAEWPHALRVQEFPR
jgi:protein gp37